ncbi:unnamed protein product [Meganyctiphanes norvegica]|uniref:Uncharacterized protein n=1 Tax=Meganyctiphanes norvegica TaxID=48144 RepID=A0AAV2SVW2_MEGNR
MLHIQFIVASYLILRPAHCNDVGRFKTHGEQSVWHFKTFQYDYLNQLFSDVNKIPRTSELGMFDTIPSIIYPSRLSRSSTSTLKASSRAISNRSFGNIMNWVWAPLNVIFWIAFTPFLILWVAYIGPLSLEILDVLKYLFCDLRTEECRSIPNGWQKVFDWESIKYIKRNYFNIKKNIRNTSKVYSENRIKPDLKNPKPQRKVYLS